MDAERFSRLEELFHGALEQPAARRKEWVRAHCGDDEALQTQLCALLNAHDEEADPLGEAVARSVADTRSPLIGRSIGRFRILGEIGRGGMGTVYEAVREAADFEQHVAIKVLRLGLRDPTSLARFSRERQLLARLTHPGIAALVDGGTAEDGTPWVAMELVRGEPITEYARSRELTLSKRIELFVRLCASVGHAHRNLVVHRDLKPDNVIVTEAGEPKVLDFGIAKLLDDDAEGTATLAQAFTPTHASPEQVRGEPVTPACDVYALGVILFELCTGEPPYKIASNRRTDWERAICEESPPRPSARLPRLSSDLDHIILMALRKEPERRYPSAVELGGDLRRYLEARPVHARPDRFGYRAAKYVSRHRWGLAAATVIFVLAVGFVVNTAIQSQRVAAERDRAVREAVIARETADFLVDLFEAPDPKQQGQADLSALDLLDRGVQRIDELNAQPLVKARLKHVMGLAYANLGRFEPGIALLEEALSMRIDETGEESAETADSRNRLGDVLRAAGRFAEAAPHLVAALKIRVTSGEGDSESLADSYNNVGLLQRDLARYDSAASNLQQAIEMHRRLNGESVPVAVAQHNLALVRLGQERPTEAIELLRSALQIKRNAGLTERSTYANSQAALASALLAAGQLPEALEAARASLELRQRILPAGHPRIAGGASTLADVQAALGDLDQAMSGYRQATTIAGAAFGESAWRTVRYEQKMGRLLEAGGDLEGAIGAYRTAVGAAKEEFDDGSLHLAEARLDLGRALLLSGRTGPARSLLEQALSVRESLLDSRHPAVIEARALVGIAAGRQETLPAAVQDDPRLRFRLLRNVLEVSGAHL